MNEIDTIFQLFQEYFPNIPLFHSLGNHDTYPIDQTPPYIYSTFLDRYNEINVLDTNFIHLFDQLVDDRIAYVNNLIKELVQQEIKG